MRAASRTDLEGGGSTEPVEDGGHERDDEEREQREQRHHVDPEQVVELLALDRDGGAEADVAAEQLDERGRRADRHQHREDAAAAVALHQLAELRHVAAQV